MCAMATVMNCKITAFFFHNLKIYVMPCSFSHESAASFVEIETLLIMCTPYWPTHDSFSAFYSALLFLAKFYAQHFVGHEMLVYRQ